MTDLLGANCLLRDDRDMYMYENTSSATNSTPREEAAVTAKSILAREFSRDAAGGKLYLGMSYPSIAADIESLAIINVCLATWSGAVLHDL